MIQRLMVVGAHPDDCELIAGGIATKVLKEIPNSEVMFVSMTNGDAGHYALYGERLREIRKKETEAVSAISGVQYSVMPYHDGYLEPSIEAREQLIRQIRTFAPQVIITHFLEDYHPDHRNACQLVRDSAYLLAVPAVASDTAVLRFLPAIWHFNPYWHEGQVTAYCDIEPYLVEKAKMIRCHDSQFFDWLPWVDGVDLSTLPKTPEDKLAYTLEIAKRRGGAFGQKQAAPIAAFFGKERASSVQYFEAFCICENAGKTDPEFLEFLRK